MTKTLPNKKTILGAAMVAVLALALPHAPAEAALNSYTGLVTHVADGDTFDVAVGSRSQRIRMLGLNAMEIGECNAEAATSRLRTLIDGKTVTLKYNDYGSMSMRGTDRYLRHVYVDGFNVARKLIAEGLALGYPNKLEPTYNGTYLRTMQEAIAAKEAPLWDNDRCGYGPNQGSRLKMWVNWDAAGADSENLNGEWARIMNQNSSTDVSMTGWEFRDTSLNRYPLPSGLKIRAGRWLTIYPGRGTNTSTRFYLREDSPIFDNSGDGVFLVDPHGDIRASFVWPCTASCSDPLKGKVNITAHPNADGNDDANVNGEWIKITNVSSSTIDLSAYRVYNRPYFYDIGHKLGLSNRLGAGEYMRLRVGKGTETRRARYWGKSHSILANSGDRVLLVTFNGIRVDCTDWGNANC